MDLLDSFCDRLSDVLSDSSEIPLSDPDARLSDGFRSDFSRLKLPQGVLFMEVLITERFGGPGIKDSFRTFGDICRLYGKNGSFDLIFDSASSRSVKVAS